MSAVHLLQFTKERKLPIIRQAEAAECGLASIAMIANYHGYKVDLTSLRREYPITLKGATLQSLISVADRLNLSSRALRLEVEDITKLMLPCILHWNMNHFVVLKRASRKHCIVYDPAEGERKYTYKQISKHFTGVALELLPTKKFVKKKKGEQLHLSDLWAKISGLKRNIAQVFLLSVLLQLFAVASPFYLQIVVDDVIISQDTDLLKVVALGFTLLILINAFIAFLRSTTILYLGTQINVVMASNLFRHLIRLPLDWFEKRHIGDVVSRFSSQDKIKDLLTTGVIEALVDGIMVIGILVMMFLYNVTLAWVVIAASTIYILVRLALYRRLQQLTEENIINSAKEDSNFMETVRAIQSIKLFSREEQRQSIWQNAYADAMNSNIRLGRLNIIYSTLNKILFGVENIIVVYLAAESVMKGLISVGMLYAFMLYKRQFTEKTGTLLEKIIQYKMLNLHLDRISDIVLTPIEDEQRTVNARRQIKGSVELSKLRFRYSKDESYIFENLGAKIRAGECVAIVGPSGCGKTTLMKVMLGLIKPGKGQVLIDGLDITKMGLTNYRNQIGAVMQDDQLLSGTIADNICFFDPNFDTQKIEDSAQLAAVHDDILTMPMGYNSLIGDMGSSLSGGQKQRIILARALYKKPKILFMDEATSHLDSYLEENVNNNIQHLKMTRIIIAHRYETIRSADRVLRLKGGTLVEVD